MATVTRDNTIINGGEGSPAKIESMGLGVLGSPNMIFKRKFRWTFEIVPNCNTSPAIPANYVKVANRPQLDIEETEINFLHTKTWIPGKAAWQALSVTYYDLAVTEIAPLWTWLTSVYNFTLHDSTHPNGGRSFPNYYMGSTLNDYSATAYLVMYDGCGQPLDQWTLNYVWPQSIQFGELDYASSEECTIELTMRYSDAAYSPICPPFAFAPCCTPCSGSGT